MTSKPTTASDAPATARLTKALQDALHREKVAGELLREAQRRENAATELLRQERLRLSGQIAALEKRQSATMTFEITGQVMFGGGSK